MTTRIFVSVGTDHHPFARLIGWVDEWARERADVVLVVQHGSSPRSEIGSNSIMLSGAELREAYRAADIVVTQVGPGTIADANRAGVMPIVVPRDPALGEVVDDHQFAFGSFMAAQGRCTVATNRAELFSALASALEDPGVHSFSNEPTERAAVNAISSLSQRVVAAPARPRLSGKRFATMFRTPRAKG